MNVDLTNKEKSLSNQLPKLEHDETGAIGISLGLTALSAAIIYSNEFFVVFRVIFLLIYILGGLASSFLFFTYLSHKIPDTIKLWISKGGMGFKGILWIYCYYTKLFIKQMMSLKGNPINKIRELGYLTILAMFHVFWLTFFLIIIEMIFNIID